MFLYIYVGYFALYKPGLLDNLRAGVVEFDISPTLLTMMLGSVAIPALMVMFSMTLPVRVNRATNLVFHQDQQISTATNAQSPASGPGHSWVEVQPTTSAMRWWPSDQPRQAACSGYPPKVQGLGCANGQVESGSGADVPAAGIRDFESTHPIKPRSHLMRTPQSHTARENPRSHSALENRRMPVQAKLAAAWTSLMFFIIYIDYFHLYQPGEIDDIRSGVIFEFDISGTLMSIFFVIIAIPTLMIMLSMTLPARVNRVTNLVVASLYSPLLILNFVGAPSGYAFYYALTIGVEVLIVAFILRAAGTWPRRTASPATLATSLDSEPLRTPQQA